MVDVNEEGTEAAAATVIEFETTSFIEPVRFIADRPFYLLFMIPGTGIFFSSARSCLETGDNLRH